MLLYAIEFVIMDLLMIVVLVLGIHSGSYAEGNFIKDKEEYETKTREFKKAA